MTWAKIDDQFHAHPKVQRAWELCRASLGLHVLALSHSGAYLTDGHVSETWVRKELPRASERQRTVKALVDSGLWEPNGSGWRIHDYLDFNERREHVLARRLARAPADVRVGAGGRTRDPTPTPFPILRSHPSNGGVA